MAAAAIKAVNEKTKVEISTRNELENLRFRWKEVNPKLAVRCCRKNITSQSNDVQK
jgi:hypothetical protein